MSVENSSGALSGVTYPSLRDHADGATANPNGLQYTNLSYYIHITVYTDARKGSTDKKG